MLKERSEIRIALPSKGRLAEEVLAFFDAAGLRVYKPNPRQYQAIIPSLPGLAVLFQRPGDIVTSVRDGSVDFGLTGWDIYCERGGQNGAMITLLEDLGIGRCSLQVIVPESLEGVERVQDLAGLSARLGRRLRVATKFPALTEAFFEAQGLGPVQIFLAEGTLEIAPTIGYADVIVDLVSTGTTLRDNRLKMLSGGQVLRSQGCLIASRQRLNDCPEALRLANLLLEYLVAHLRAVDTVAVFANVCGVSPQAIARHMATQTVLGGLQGPTISPVLTRSGEGWFAVHIIVRKDQLTQAIGELRQVGGSGVVVTPVTYIFEAEPQVCRDLAAELARPAVELARPAVELVHPMEA